MQNSVSTTRKQNQQQISSADQREALVPNRKTINMLWVSVISSFLLMYDDVCCGTRFPGF